MAKWTDCPDCGRETVILADGVEVHSWECEKHRDPSLRVDKPIIVNQ